MWPISFKYKTYTFNQKLHDVVEISTPATPLTSEVVYTTGRQRLRSSDVANVRFQELVIIWAIDHSLLLDRVSGTYCLSTYAILNLASWEFRRFCWGSRRPAIIAFWAPHLLTYYNYTERTRWNQWNVLLAYRGQWAYYAAERKLLKDFRRRNGVKVDSFATLISICLSIFLIIAGEPSFGSEFIARYCSHSSRTLEGLKVTCGWRLSCHIACLFSLPGRVALDSNHRIKTLYRQSLAPATSAFLVYILVRGTYMLSYFCW